MSDKTRVYLTVDVECAEERTIGGRELPAQGYDVRVWGRFANQPVDLGIGLIMRELEKFDFRATFFTEVLGSNTFGLEGLREVTTEMRRRGHDVQLHAHPIQRNARYRSDGIPPAHDDIGAYSVSQQTAMLREGIDILVQCGVPRDDVLAFRAGNYGANNDTWAAMAAVGLRVSSSYNPCYFGKNCRLRYDASSAGLFRAENDIYELPISNFVEKWGGGGRRGGRGGRPRHMQITAVSLAEMKSYLLESRRLGIGEVTLVTHSFEFCHIDSIEERLGRVNSLNLLRLRGLCSFLKEHSDELEVETVGALAKRIASSDTDPSWSGTEMPRGRRRDRARRLVEQAYKRVEAKLPFSAPVL